jgi:Rad3-related DNA helicase
MMNETAIARNVRKTLLSKLPDILGECYEVRQGQIDMAGEAARVFCDEGILVVEAETGLGKSLAYLVPLLMCCAEMNVRAVVSTHTRTLQHQLIEKDYCQAAKTVGAGVEAAVLQGRANYACKRTIANLLERAGLESGTEDFLRSLFDHTSGEIERIATDSTVNANVLRDIACPAGESVCIGCRLREDCFLYRARKKALASQVVLVNHALLFSDLSTSGALLGPYDILVIDEAHHLPEVATQYLALSVSPKSIKGSPQSLQTATYEEVVAYVREMAAYEDSEAAHEIDGLWRSIVSHLEEAYRAAVDFFAQLTEIIRSMPNEKGRSGSANSYAENVRYYEGAPIFYNTDNERDNIAANLAATAAGIERMLHIISRNETLSQSSAPDRLRFLYDGVMELQAKFDFVTAAGDSEYVFFAEMMRDGSVSALHALPIDVSPQLGALLEERCKSTLLTSATLAVDNDFSYILRQLGLDGSTKTETKRYESPFDMNSQRAIYLASYMPGPSDAAYLQRAADTIIQVAAVSQKKILVLCTSKIQLERVYEILMNDEATKESTLAQRESMTRSALIDQFKESRGKKILLGLSSFWEGVDFPGEYLEIIIVMKMPFLVPTEPLSQARSERLRERGENPFLEFVLPDAVLRLRQGFGRLIRTSSDRGAVIILDARLKNRAYGEQVLRAVSEHVQHCEHMDDLVAGIQEIFD